MPRLFVGLELPEEVKEELASLERLVGSIMTGRWIPTRNLHLTLKFLGHVHDELVPAISRTVAESVRGSGSFSLSLGEVGAFPSPRRARILWYGVDEGADEARHLAHAIESSAESLGYQPEKRAFHPHITLARIGSPQDLSAAVGSIGKALKNVTIEIRNVTMFESKLLRGGAEYSVLERYPV